MLDAPWCPPGGKLEIHRPKLARNWREFALEMGTITCGILIALVLDQTVEWLHRRAELGDARAALRAEIAQNARVANYGMAADRCVTGLLDRHVAWAMGGAHAPTGLAGGLPPASTSAWDVVKVSVAAHMPLKERIAYSAIYDGFQDLQWAVQAQRATLIRLYGDAGMIKLSPADAQRVLADSAEARIATYAHLHISDRVIQAAKAMGVEPPPISANGRDMLAKLCALSR
jgi:hypothetical protein